MTTAGMQGNSVPSATPAHEAQGVGRSRRTERTAVSVVVWNARAPGWHRIQALVDESPIWRPRVRRRWPTSRACRRWPPRPRIQRTRRRAQASGGFKTHTAGGTAIAMRAPWEDRIIDIGAGAQWLGAMFAGTKADKYITLLSLHLPTAWAPDELWVASVAEFDAALGASRTRRLRQHLLLAGDLRTTWTWTPCRQPRVAGAA